MLNNLSKTQPVPPAEAWRDDVPPQPGQDSGTDDARMAKLLEQEQLWFSWLTVLHERLGKLKPGDSAAEGKKVLEIARRRWVEAKEALRHYHAGD
jgi:hypothetical protein